MEEKIYDFVILKKDYWKAVNTLIKIKEKCKYAEQEINTVLDILSKIQ